MSDNRGVFNPPPGWPPPPAGWTPPKGWTPDPSWPDPPPGWQLWLPASGDAEVGSEDPGAPAGTAASGSPRTPGEPDGRAPGSADTGARIALLEAENAALRAQLDAVRSGGDDIVILDDERVLQDVGIYRYHHPLENALAYRERLDDLARRIAELVRADAAIVKSNMSRAARAGPRAGRCLRSVPLRRARAVLLRGRRQLGSRAPRHFASRRVNFANSRKEFFFARPAEVRDVLAAKVGNLLEFVEHAQSTEYLQSLRYWPPLVAHPGPEAPAGQLAQ